MFNFEKLEHQVLRFRDSPEDTLRFLYEPEVSFTNSLAEQDLRMMKCKQKISGAFELFKMLSFCENPWVYLYRSKAKVEYLRFTQRYLFARLYSSCPPLNPYSLPIRKLTIPIHAATQHG